MLSNDLATFEGCDGDLCNGVFLLTALGVAFAVVEVLRVLRFFGAVAFGVVGTGVDLTGIGFRSDVYFYNIAIKNPLWGV